MNPKKIIPIFVAANALMFNQADAQNTTTPANKPDSTFATQKLDIYDNYKPTVIPTPKPEFKPSLPTIEQEKVNFNYQIPQQNLSYTYKSVPIRPLALQMEDFKLPYQNYVKAGLGNRHNLLLDAGIGSLYGANYTTDLHLSHFSQKGSVANQQSSNTQFDAETKYNWTDHTLLGTLNVGNRAMRYYGYDNVLYPNYATDDLKQSFTEMDLMLSFFNTSLRTHHIKYAPTVGINLYNDKHGASEQHFTLEVPVSYVLDSTFQFNLAAKADITHFKNEYGNQENNYFQIKPSVDIKSEKINLHLGAKPTWGKNNVAYLLPDIQLKGLLGDRKLAYTLGWEGHLVKNSYNELSKMNPFMSNDFLMRQSKTDQIYAGLSGTFGNHLSANATVSYKRFKNMAQFANNYYLAGDGKQFDVIYDELVESVELRLGMDYQFAEKFNLKGDLIWNNYSPTTYRKVWMQPAMQLAFGLDWKPIKKLNLGLGFEYWDGMHYLDANNNARDLEGFVDFNAHADYQIVPRLNVFLEGNNLFNNRYQRWNQYSTYGINFIGGVRFKF